MPPSPQGAEEEGKGKRKGFLSRLWRRKDEGVVVVVAPAQAVITFQSAAQGPASMVKVGHTHAHTRETHTHTHTHTHTQQQAKSQRRKGESPRPVDLEKWASDLDRDVTSPIT